MLREFDQYRKDGYIELSQFVKDVDYEVPNGLDHSFTYQGEKYFVKITEKGTGAIREIVNQSISTALNKDNAEYDIVRCDKYLLGTVTKNFIKEKSELQVARKLLVENGVPNFIFIENRNCRYIAGGNNIYSYIIALLNKGCSIEDIRIMIRILLERHIMDIFSVQTDRNNGNTGFIKTDSTIELAPRYDNGRSFLYRVGLNAKKDFVKESYEERKEFIQNKKFFYTDSWSMSTIYPQISHALDSTNHNNILVEYWRAKKGVNIPPIVRSIMDRYELKPNIQVSQNEICKMIQEEMNALSPFIERAESVDLNEIFRELADSKIPITRLDQEFFKAIQDTAQEMFGETEQKVYCRR